LPGLIVTGKMVVKAWVSVLKSRPDREPKFELVAGDCGSKGFATWAGGAFCRMSMYFWTRCLIVGFLGIAPCAWAQDDFLNHVVFSNSNTADNDFYTGANSVAPSSVATIDGRLPVETSTFVSPPNALRVEWTSAEGGSWDAEVRVLSYDNRPADFRGDTLSFWCFAAQPIAEADLPQIELLDDDHDFTTPIDLGKYLRGLGTGRWVQVKIPLRELATASVRPFEARTLHSVFFSQGRADNAQHTMFVDEIRIDSGISAPAVKALSLAVPHGLEAKGYERHVDLKWEATDTANLAYYLVERSLNGGPYQPVGIEEPGIHRYTDFVGAPGMKAAYRIAAVDKADRKSAFSQKAEASTREFSDDELLTMVQEECFRYYWEQGSHPVSGMALESVPGDKRIVATGASGFGVMAIVVGMERGFITREQGMERLTKIVNFLGKAQRYHGAWPHFLNGATGQTMPVFGMFDNGGDLVETSFLIEGLLAARQYANGSSETERALAKNITALWETVEWDWYARQAGGDALIWHWSPQWSWRIDHRLTGFNETMATYLLAIASPTHGVPASTYYSGWAAQSKTAAAYRIAWSGTSDGDQYQNGHTYEGIRLDVGVGDGGPLFFTQYSFMGPDPRKIRDEYTAYFENNRKIALINYQYSQANPGHFKGYGPGVWGLTASLDPYGYSAHAPNISSDNGTIAPTGALGSFPYTPDESMAALKYMYRTLGDRLWGVYGPTDAFNLRENWFSPVYLGLDQAPIVVMIENKRSESIWDLFMSNPEMRPMLADISHGPSSKVFAEGQGK
jgi:hypothetical protein